MPWSLSDVSRFKKGLSQEEAKGWVRRANAIYRRCMAAGGSDEECAKRAVIIANSKS